MKEIEMMAEPLEMEIPEPTITIKLTTRLRCSATRESHPSHCEMLHDAADEIERLQKLIGSNDPVALLKELWKHHHPVYLFEAIADATQKEVV